MFPHDGPEFIEDEDGGVIATCICGWETEICETQRQAEDQFNEEHFFAGIELEEDQVDDLGLFTSIPICSFCGNEGHRKNDCSRRSLLKI